MIELLEGEVCLPLRDYPGYSITNYGRVWSDRSNKFLRVYEANHYYHRVKMGRKNIKKIHVLVGRTHLPSYKEGLLILHKDETLAYPQIHYADNLWVGTQSDNLRDAIKKGRK